MNFSQKMRSFTVLALFACIAITAATDKEFECCKEISSERITLPITGFKVQQARPPCVKAIIFYTSEGAVCSHWRENWVMSKVIELRKLQAVIKRLKMKTTTTPQTDNSTLQLQ
ncbi:hypothetical protein QTP70_025236 [Hemibagrus guttatus]|uniref:Chemokine interleukin-8-like domain-containing protein n=1 Tax=Hemibagrus guttatus TaxID=175788 RepID=A0AAE0R7B9_9TELE|nr:hypothetical protein QTP70_025236 [Hemibagrus guttatus]KAK3567859.1 hypothetical protein QTP86_027342 [Hemibagrus guttatus]